ncbi:PREDICTED: receptor-like protein kinase FERONIA [Nelumbo nucifera]|uniref:non-specific serine/threonine protein kinase n=2 Tax=Nelumbo nucifera TaxID=4432 RepID=A0A822XRD0_NELNU|nr:PREDICTED: receptor-like protein kinase FERONIA [Nelumbo nucifera]DAD24154.1 TPA_asm: hypothetical protein HUJ06_025617 [Nelumbo nucifera]
MENTERNCLLSLLAPLYLFTSLIISGTAYTPYVTTYQVFVDCGSHGEVTESHDGRNWTGDFGGKYKPYANIRGSTFVVSVQGISVPQIPYMTARIFRSHLTYKFSDVSAGPKFIRLYFYPASYSNLNQSYAFFDVSAGPYILLRNFSASLTANFLDTDRFFKEFVVNIERQSELIITFSPTPNIFETHGFVNGIEILSMPDNFYIRDEILPYAIRQNDIPVALEMVYRLNVGGREVSPQDDTGMYRTWSEDTPYFHGGQPGVIPVNATISVTYTPSVPSYTAPESVYRTARSMGMNKSLNEKYDLTWSFPVDSSGFYYLFRLHFCEFLHEITKRSERIFRIFIRNQTAEERVDIIEWSGGNGIPVYRDHIVVGPNGNEGNQDMWLALRPNLEAKPLYSDEILNGLEIFKLSKTDGDLSEPNPIPTRNWSLSPTWSSSRRSDNSKKQISFIVAGGVAGVVVIVSIIFFFSSRRARRVKSNTSIPQLSNLCRHFSLAEIKAATNNFDERRVIGVGGFGKVYRGCIDGGTTSVAVKRGNPKSQQGAHEFQTEIELLSKLRHFHLVSLIGYCEERGELILVYDYMAQGTLRHHLYKTDKSPLPWKQRLEICIGAARGLHYLHTGDKYRIIHRDVKTTNILLDEKWVAKVSDFGLSKMGPTASSLSHTHVSTAVKGSFGYLDPEYYRRQHLTEKSDVYSFGVVLFEVLCARPALDHKLPEDEVLLAHWALCCLHNATLDQILDPYLRDKIAPECLKKFTEIAEKCLADRGAERPTMADVLWNLEFALQLQESAEKISNSVDDSCRDGGRIISSECNGVMSFSEIVNPEGR